MPKKNPSTLSDIRDKFFQTAKIRWEFFKRSKAYKANPQKYGDQSPVEILLAAAKKEKGLKQATAGSSR